MILNLLKVIRKEWMKNITFDLEGFGSTEKLFNGMAFDDYLEKVATYLKENNKELDQYLNYILMPPKEVHPDGIWIANFEGKLYFILFSCKCYMTCLDVRDECCSTMIDRIYLEDLHIPIDLIQCIPKSGANSLKNMVLRKIKVSLVES